VVEAWGVMLGRGPGGGGRGAGGGASVRRIAGVWVVEQSRDREHIGEGLCNL